ncbi:ETX/MTX2 family pore-forming toxin [Salinispora arenicola]|uniref:ETX/MTX2 family pore-forming toxin n=1 Tax=Salinispora arenicola TaxID=168697 RepID=UPI0004B69B11|nr:ETX/MTX2 family pore-forming toxin [Salinispora arenicola]
MKMSRARMFAALSISTVASVLIAAAPAQAATVTSLESIIKDQSYYVYWGGLHNIHTFTISQTEKIAVPVGTPTIVQGERYYLGCAVLTNNTSIDQTLKSNSFSRTRTNIVSTTVATGVSTTFEVSGTFEFSKVVNFGTKKSTTISYQESTTQTTRLDDRHTAPSQSVLVPAGTTRYVVASLTPATYTGNLALNTSFQGNFWGTQIMLGGPRSFDLYDFLTEAKSKGTTLPSGFSLNTAKKTLDFQGAGTYTLEVGVNFSVEVSETLPSHMAKGSCV